MTTATELATEWDVVVSEFGNTITLYNPTLTYNDESDVSAYTLGSGTSTTAIILEDPSGTDWASEVEGIDNMTLAKKIVELNLPFDQLIAEFVDPAVPGSGWVHVSYDPQNLKKQSLTAVKKDGKTVYLPGLVA